MRAVLGHVGRVRAGSSSRRATCCLQASALPLLRGVQRQAPSLQKHSIFGRALAQACATFKGNIGRRPHRDLPSEEAIIFKDLGLKVRQDIQCIKLTALIGCWLLAGADGAVEVGLPHDLGPVDDAIAVALLVAVVAEASRAVVAGHQAAAARTPEAGTAAG